ncbi:MAG TPA: hypothetical protein VGC09_22860 [Rhodopila sp.]
MTIIRSLGVTTLVALMSAHRGAAEQLEAARPAFDQAAVEALEAYLRGHADRPCSCWGEESVRRKPRISKPERPVRC